MAVSNAQARDVLRLLLVIMVIDDQIDPDELEAIRAAVRALDGRPNGMNVTRATEILGTLAAAGLVADHTKLVWASLMAGLDAIIAQALASGTDAQRSSLATTTLAHLHSFPSHSSSSR